MWRLITWLVIVVVAVIVAGLIYFAVADVKAPSQPVERIISNDASAPK